MARYITPYGRQVPFTISELAGVQPWVGLTGAVPDCRRVSDATMLAGSFTLTSPTAAWGDVVNGAQTATEWGLPLAGKFIAVAGAGPGGSDLLTTIAAWISPSELLLADQASTDVEGVDVIWGTDNTAALQAAFDQFAALRVPVRLHFGSYLTGMLRIPSGLHLVGSGHRSSWLVFRPGASANNCAMLETAGLESTPGDPYAPIVEDLVFRDFGIDGLGGYSAGSHSWHPTQHMSLMFLWWSRNVELTNVWLENANISGCVVGGAFDGVTFDNCHFEDATVPGNTFASTDFSQGYVDQNGRARLFTNGALLRFWDVERDSSGLTIRNNCELFAHTCRGTCFKGGANPGASVTDVLVTGNHFKVGVVPFGEPEQVLDAPGPGQADTLGFEYWSPQDIDVSGNLIEAVDVVDDRPNVAFAISLIRAYGGSRAVVSTNRLKECHAFAVECNLPDSLIRDNVIYHCGPIQFQAANPEYVGPLNSGITVSSNRISKPRPGSVNVHFGYPVVAISAYVAQVAGTILRGCVVSSNVIDLNADYPDWDTANMIAVQVGINTIEQVRIEDFRLDANTVVGTGNSRELAFVLSRLAGDGLVKRVFAEKNSVTRVNNGFILDDGVVECRLTMNAVDEATVPFPYVGTFDATTRNSVTEHASDTTGFASGKDPRALAATSVKVRGQEYPMMREDGCFQLPARLSYFARAYFTAPPGVSNNANVIALNSVGNGPHQGGWLSVNSWRADPDFWRQTSKMFDFSLDGDTVTIAGTGETNDPIDGERLWVTGFSGTGLDNFTRYLVADVDVGPPYTLTLRPDAGGSALSGSGTGKLSALPYATFVQLAASRFAVGFGLADNSGTPTDPWDDAESAFGAAFLVHNERNDAGLTVGAWRSGVYAGYPLYPEYSFGPGIRSSPGGGPNGNLDGGVGMMALDSASGGHLWVKTTDWSTLTGWVDIGPAAVTWAKIDDDTIGTPYQVRIGDGTTRDSLLTLLAKTGQTQDIFRSKDPSGVARVVIRPDGTVVIDADLYMGASSSDRRKIRFRFDDPNHYAVYDDSIDGPLLSGWGGVVLARQGSARLTADGDGVKCANVSPDEAVFSDSTGSLKSESYATARATLNVYSKSETYTKSEVDALVSGLVSSSIFANHQHAVSGNTSQESNPGDPHTHAITVTSGTPI